jgi:hypothetical protein
MLQKTYRIYIYIYIYIYIKPPDRKRNARNVYEQGYVM